MNFRRKDTPSAAAAKASFSTATAYRIEPDSRPPSQKQTPRSSRRSDPLDGIFEKDVVPLLVESPALRAVTIFEELRRRYPEFPVGSSLKLAFFPPDGWLFISGRLAPLKTDQWLF